MKHYGKLLPMSPSQKEKLFVAFLIVSLMCSACIDINDFFIAAYSTESKPKLAELPETSDNGIIIIITHVY